MVAKDQRGNYSPNPGVKTLKKITKHKAKGSQQDMLPSRHALNQLAGGADPLQRRMGNYSKATPSGEGALDYLLPGMFRGF